MQRIDLMDAIAQRPFFKEPKKRYGLKTTLLLSNAFWIIVTMILSTLALSLTKVGSLITGELIQQRARINEMRQAQAAAIAEQDAKITRLLAYQSSSTTDILKMAKSIERVYTTADNPTEMKFLDEALPEALRIQITEGVPASAVLAQAILESHYGTSTIARESHNYHGIKAFGNWTGPRVSGMATIDFGPNGPVQTVADFRAYSSMADGFDGYVQFLRANDRYSAAFNQKTGLAFIQEVIKGGYCPDPSYIKSIKEIIDRHDLTVLDEIFAAQVAKASVTPAPKTGADS